MNGKPTPTPWRQQRENPFVIEAGQIDSRNKSILLAAWNSGTTQAEALANVAITVTAVNYHERLKAALRELAEADAGGEATPDYYDALEKAAALLDELDKEAGDALA